LRRPEFLEPDGSHAVSLLDVNVLLALRGRTMSTIRRPTLVCGESSGGLGDLSADADGFVRLSMQPAVVKIPFSSGLMSAGPNDRPRRASLLAARGRTCG